MSPRMLLVAFIWFICLIHYGQSAACCCDEEYKKKKDAPLPMRQNKRTSKTKLKATPRTTSRPPISGPAVVPDQMEMGKGFDQECTDILAIIPEITSVDRIKMKRVCQSRFNQLVKMHKTYQDSLKTFNLTHKTSDLASNLLMIELDDTIINQRTFYFHRQQISKEFWRSANKRELMYNFNGMAQPKAIGFELEHNIGDDYHESTGMVGIFRKGLMNFIAYLHTNRRKHQYDIVLYSSGISDLAIYHALTIEIYYNFFYAVKQESVKQKHYFEFKFVIGRMSTLTAKSLITVMRMFGNNGFGYHALKQYEKIMIIDPTQSAVWNEVMPKALKAIGSNASLIYYAPGDYDLVWELRRAMELTPASGEYVFKRWSEDNTFQLLFNEMQHLQKMTVPNTNSRWIRVQHYFQ